MVQIKNNNDVSQDDLSLAAFKRLVTYEEAKATGNRIVPDGPADDSVRDGLACVDLLHRVWPDLELPAIGNDRPPPKTLGDFRLIREIGRGGMGTVFEAEQISMGRHVALKVLPFAALVHENSLQRFRNEVRAAAALDHPHIVSVYFIGDERGVHFYAMQLIRGRTLADLISELREVGKAPSPCPLPEEEDSQTTISEQARISTAVDSPRDAESYRTAARLGIQAAEALQHAHDQGVLHRDIKPSNLMLDSEGKLFVTDFGLARIEADAGMTMTGDIVGTLRYMAPEQALAKRVVIDHRADIYSLGATLYELLTLHPAFSETDRSELIKQIAFNEPRSLRKLDPRIPSELETIVLKAMSKSPDERYEKAQHFADDLRAYLENRPIRAKPPTLLNRATKWSARHRHLVLTSSLFVAALTIISVVALVYGNLAITRERNAAREAAGRESAIAAQAKKERAEAIHLQSLAEQNMVLMTSGVMPAGAAFGPDGNLYVASIGADTVVRFDGATGELMDTFVSGGNGDLDRPYALAFGLDVNEDGAPELYVASSRGNSVIRYDGLTGAYLDTVVKEESGGLLVPTGLAFGADGQLYVAGYWSHNILRYDSRTGKFIDEFVKCESGGLKSPQSPTFGPDGNLYVANSENGEVLRYDRTTGKFIDSFVASDAGRRKRIGGLTFGPDGNMYVASRDPDGAGKIVRYDGTTGKFIDELHPPSDDSMQNGDLLFGADHDLYVVSSANSSVARYDISIGKFKEHFVTRQKFLDASLLNYCRLSSRHIENIALVYRLTTVYVRSGKIAEACQLVEKETNLSRVDRESSYGVLAWDLATSTSPKSRDGRKAVQLATEACRLCNYRFADRVDTLAAAYAEMGDFEAAIKWSQKTIEISKSDPAGSRYRQDCLDHLESFKNRKPWREK